MSTGRRYTAEEMLQMAGLLELTRMVGAASALRQAAEIEAQVMGLVEALNSVVNNIETGASTACVQRIAFEALSKFRGEV